MKFEVFLSCAVYNCNVAVRGGGGREEEGGGGEDGGGGGGRGGGEGATVNYAIMSDVIVMTCCDNPTVHFVMLD